MYHRSAGPHILPFPMSPCTLTSLRVGQYKPFYEAQIEFYQYFQNFHLYKNCIYYKIQVEINFIHLFETLLDLVILRKIIGQEIEQLCNNTHKCLI